jgi:hypothetical protein
MDTVLIVEWEKLDEALWKVAFVEGIQDTKSYVALQTIK